LFMDQRVEELAKECAEYEQRFNEAHGQILTRFRALRIRREERTKEWVQSGPHADEAESSCQGLLRTCNSYLVELNQIATSRNEKMKLIMKASSKIKDSKTRRKIPILEELRDVSRYELLEGLPREVEVMDKYETSISKFEDFVESQVSNES